MANGNHENTNPQAGCTSFNSLAELEALTDEMVSIGYTSGSPESVTFCLAPNDEVAIPDIALIRGGLNIVRTDPELSAKYTDGLAQEPTVARDGRIFLGLAAARAVVVGLEVIVERAEQQEPVPPHTNHVMTLQAVLAHAINKVVHIPHE